MGDCKQGLGKSHQDCGLSDTHATSFLQECSRPGSDVGIFLKTPLLHKVQELQRTLVGPDGNKDQGVLGVLTSRSVTLLSQNAIADDVCGAEGMTYVSLAVDCGRSCGCKL